MSTQHHPHLELWNRDGHDGTYRAVVNDWTLVVKWRDDSPEKHRGFWFEATSAKGKKYIEAEVEEEMEVAMGHAEAFAERDAAGLGIGAAP